MAARLTRTSNSVPDELSGLRELVRMLARQAAREVVASSGAAPSSVASDSKHQTNEDQS